MKNHNTHKSLFKKLKRLLKDEAGNTMIFMGASLIPLLAIIGGGVDASRGYMAKARLQQACDAATLAGRRAVGDSSFDANAELQANKLFNANFETGFLGAVNTKFTASSADSGNTVEGVASVEIPTVIMRIFGNNELTISATCAAALDVANADIMMVLDTTGSMGFDINGNSLDPTGAGRQVDSSGNPFPGSRILDLRVAAKSFYDVLNNATSSSKARIRYGFVPYSSTVNVGRLIAGNSGASLLTGDNAGDTHIYPTRRAVYEIDLPDLITNNQSFETFTRPDGREALFTFNQCDQGYGENQSFQYYILSGGVPVLQTFNQPNAGNPITIGDTTFTYRRSRRINRRAFPGVGNLGQCIRRVNTETRTPQTAETYDGTAPGARFLRFEYSNLPLEINDYVNSIDPSNPAAKRPSEREDQPDILDRWSGCIEERDTVTADPGDIGFSSILGISPGGASDLDIDGVPTNEATRWRPLWPEVAYNRVNDAFTQFIRDPVANRGQIAGGSCPQPARLMSELTETEFDTYIDSLRPSGATYHDIGAIWGARLASPNGIFQTNVNETAPNNSFVSRNMIFLTDGTLQPSRLSYSAYGTEFQNPLVGPSNSSNEELRQRHDARFLAICEAIKNKKIRIFVVAFGTALTPSLRSCASADSAFVANDAAALNDRFLQIATNIADLRLTN